MSLIQGLISHNNARLPSYYEVFYRCTSNQNAQVLPSHIAHLSEEGIIWRYTLLIQPTRNVQQILKCFPLLDMLDSELSGLVSLTVRVCQVPHSTSQCMLKTPFASMTHAHAAIHHQTNRQKNVCTRNSLT